MNFQNYFAKSPFCAMHARSPNLGDQIGRGCYRMDLLHEDSNTPHTHSHFSLIISLISYFLRWVCFDTLLFGTRTGKGCFLICAPLSEIKTLHISNLDFFRQLPRFVWIFLVFRLSRELTRDCEWFEQLYFS